MLILILIDVHYSQKTVFSFEKGLNPQNHSSSGSLSFPSIWAQRFLCPEAIATVIFGLHLALTH